MKGRFTTLDVIAGVAQLRNQLTGMRINQIYDVDHKTYILKFTRQEEKVVFIFESGVRFHTTNFTWPKNMSPSGFSMKMRKHLRNKRLECISQLGVDRVVDMQFGTGEASYHIILELYDKGNVILTDHEYTILNILRPRAAGDEDVRLVVRERYPVSSAQQRLPSKTLDDMKEIIANAKPGENIKKILLPHVYCGAPLLEHCLIAQNISPSSKFGSETADELTPESLLAAFNEIESVLHDLSSSTIPKGVIVQKASKSDAELFVNDEFHPIIFRQHTNDKLVEYPTFLEAVDVFFSTIEEQKITMKQSHQEKQAIKKLDNIKQDHEMRLAALAEIQRSDVVKGELIEMNADLVEKALAAIRSAIATQMSWGDITQLILDAKTMGDPVARQIEKIDFQTNRFTMRLGNPYDDDSIMRSVEIAIECSAHANARRYFDQKRFAAKKEQKTIEASEKAFKSAAKKTRQMLKQVQLTSNIAKARKSFWFEKFFWFVSSENYMVVGGRDAQQNELLVKRYLSTGDIYVHADLHGASSVIIKNHNKDAPIPPKTLNEAGTMAMCYSAAWQAKVITAVWWVYHHQVSKTAPTGEYLTSGSFMIRGKKNYLSPSFLLMGFGFLFRLDECSIARHADERRVRTLDDDGNEAPAGGEGGVINNDDDVVDVIVSSDDDQEDDNNGTSFPDTQAKVVDVLTPFSRNTAFEMTGEGDDAVVVGSQQQRTKQISNKKKKKQQGKGSNQEEQKQQEAPKQPRKMSKAKLRKIKEKYKDQDDEERMLRMMLLGKKIPEPIKIVEEQQQQEEDEKMQEQQQVEDSVRILPEQKPVSLHELHAEQAKKQQDIDAAAQKESKKYSDDDNDDDTDNDDDEEGGSSLQQEQELLNSLTGMPLPEDNLLFAIPVVAPYTAMQSYKYKVKLGPGTTKRGKAAKTAIEIFSRDRAATQREKDLIRATKDQDIARNIPGTVKLSAQHFKRK